MKSLSISPSGIKLKEAIASATRICSTISSNKISLGEYAVKLRIYRYWTAMINDVNKVNWLKKKMRNGILMNVAASGPNENSDTGIV